MLLMSGYNDCIVGVVERAGQPAIACYDLDKVLAKLQQDGMTYEEAMEYYEFNMLGAYVGEETPCFLLTPGDRSEPWLEDQEVS